MVSGSWLCFLATSAPGVEVTTVGQRELAGIGARLVHADLISNAVSVRVALIATPPIYRTDLDALAIQVLPARHLIMQLTDGAQRRSGVGVRCEDTPKTRKTIA